MLDHDERRELDDIAHGLWCDDPGWAWSFSQAQQRGRRRWRVALGLVVVVMLLADVMVMAVDPGWWPVLLLPYLAGAVFGAARAVVRARARRHLHR